MEEIVSSENATIIYQKRQVFLDKSNDVLTLSEEELKQQGPSAIDIINVIQNFSLSLGTYLSQSFNQSSVSLASPEIAIEVAALPPNDNVLIVASENLGNMTISRTSSIKSSHSLDNHPAELATAFLPKSLLNRTSNLTLYTAVYRQPHVFITKEPSKLGSVVLSVALEDFRSKELSSPIHLQFRKLTEGSFQCVYWKFAADDGRYGHWDTSGCQITKDTPEVTRCKCNHLTNFALLLSPNSNVNDPFLRYITWGGCGLSFVSLLITILMHFSIDNSASQITVRFSISYILFILAFLIFADRTILSLTDIGCKIASSLIHFLLLTTFLLMGSQAVNMQRIFIRNPTL